MPVAPRSAVGQLPHSDTHLAERDVCPKRVRIQNPQREGIAVVFNFAN